MDFKQNNFPRSTYSYSLIYEQPLRSVKDLDYLTNVESMTLYPSFHEIPSLMTLKHLTLGNTDQMSPLSNLSHLTSLSINLINNKEDLLPLQYIKHLKINNCDRIEDFSILGDGKQTCLSLGNACNLTNVHNFQSIHQLYLDVLYSKIFHHYMVFILFNYHFVRR